MPDPTPIPSASALARAVEASERNRQEEFDRGWNAAVDALRRELETAKLTASTAAYLEPRAAFAMAKNFLMRRLDTLRRDTPDAR